MPTKVQNELNLITRFVTSFVAALLAGDDYDENDMISQIYLAPLSMLMINEFTLNILAEEGAWTAIKENAVPSMTFVDVATTVPFKFLKEGEIAPKAYKPIPVLGYMFYKAAKASEEIAQQEASFAEEPSWGEEHLESLQNATSFLRGY